MKRFKLKLEFTPESKNRNYRYFQTPKGMYFLKSNSINNSLSSIEYTIIEVILDLHSMPDGKDVKSYGYSTLYNYLNIDKSNFYKAIKALNDKGYITINDNEIKLNIDYINNQIKEIKEKGMKALNDETKDSLKQQILEKDEKDKKLKEYTNQLNKALQNNNIEEAQRISNMIQQLSSNEADSEQSNDDVVNNTEEQEKEPETPSNNNIEQQFNDNGMTEITNLPDVNLNKADLEPVNDDVNNTPEKVEKETETPSNGSNFNNDDVSEISVIPVKQPVNNEPVYDTPDEPKKKTKMKRLKDMRYLYLQLSGIYLIIWKEVKKKK